MGKANFRLKVCPQCKSVDKMIPLMDRDKMLTCRDSWHPPQAFPRLEGSGLTHSCGPHCGIKDKMEGHCVCKDCHNGSLSDGLVPLKSQEGKSVDGVRPD